MGLNFLDIWPFIGLLSGGVFSLLQTKKLTNQSRSSHDGRLFWSIWVCCGAGKFFRIFKRRSGAMLHGVEVKSFYWVFACLRVGCVFGEVREHVFWGNVLELIHFRSVNMAPLLVVYNWMFPWDQLLMAFSSLNHPLNFRKNLFCICSQSPVRGSLFAI